MNFFRRLFRSLNTIVAALICVIIGLAIGFLILTFLSWRVLASGTEAYTIKDVIVQAWDLGFIRILEGGAYPIFNYARASYRQMRSELALMAPLLMCGLSVGFAFKTGLFNIGAAGQYTLGAFGALLCGLVFKWPWYLCLLAAAVFGAVWGAIPGFFKAFFNINEVITAIMFNWIGLYGVNTLMYDTLKTTSTVDGKTTVTYLMYNIKTTKTFTLKSVNADAIIPQLGSESFLSSHKGSVIAEYLKSPVTYAVVIAIVIAVLLLIVLNKTTFGYELKACGYSRTAAKYADINEKRNIILSMAISGALAGLGAGLYYLTDTLQWNPQESTALPGIGFDGISVALLASSHPIGTIFSALLMAHISTGGSLFDASLFPPEVANIISGVIIYLCAFMMLFKNLLLKPFGIARRRRERRIANGKGGSRA